MRWWGTKEKRRKLECLKNRLFNLVGNAQISRDVGPCVVRWHSVHSFTIPGAPFQRAVWRDRRGNINACGSMCSRIIKLYTKSIQDFRDRNDLFNHISVNEIRHACKGIDIIFVVVGPCAVLTVFLEIDHHLLDFVLCPRLVRCADIESDQHHV